MAPMDAEEFRKAGYQAIDQSLSLVFALVLRGSRPVLSDGFGADRVAFCRTWVHAEIIAR